MRIRSRLCLGVIALVGLAAVASAGYTNDFSSLDNITTRKTTTPPISDPYLDYGDTAVSVDVPLGATGYLYTDLFINGPSSGIPWDCTGDTEVTVTWRFDGPPEVTGDIMTMWLRVYCGTWNGSAWTMTNRADYNFTVPVNGGWVTQVKDFKCPDGLYYATVPFDFAGVYKFRFDVVYWDAKYTPAKFSYDHFSIYPGAVAGACCFADGTCQAPLSPDCCSTKGGAYQGDGTDCASPCPQPEACCFTDLHCEELAPWACIAAAGTPQGLGTTCGPPNPCIDYWYDSVDTLLRGGNGWNGGQWIEYPSGWINQWWLNEVIPDYVKVITLDLNYVNNGDPPPTVAVNYTTAEYTNATQPPQVGEEAFIVRIPIDPPVVATGHYTYRVVLPFCPLWVSVDVMNNGGPFYIEGTIDHICVPPVGACCYCLTCVPDMSEVDCTASGGMYAGTGVGCDPNPCAATIGLVFYLPMDQQVNIGLGDAITSHTGFDTNGVDGWTTYQTNQGWNLDFPVLWFDRAAGSVIDATNSKVQWTARYFQGLGNTNPYSDAPLLAMLVDNQGRRCNDEWIFRATQADPTTQYPNWMAVEHTDACLTGSGFWTDINHDRSMLQSSRWGCTDWNAPVDPTVNQDFYDIKDILIMKTDKPMVTGACCLSDGTCLPDLTLLDCVNVNDGMWRGPCTTCPDDCVDVRGACCLADQSCVDGLTEEECWTLGATQFQYPGTFYLGQTCTQVEPCPVVLGACCHLDGSCTDETPATCDGKFMGYGIPCTPNPCDQPGACCLPDGTCTVTPAWNCTAQGGAAGGGGTTCDPFPCPPNDACANATPIDVPSVTPGDNTLATLGTLGDTVPDGCCHAPGSETGDLWYTLVGNGYDITVDTCATNPSWDTIIAVYSGDCANLACVNCNDDNDTCIDPPGWSGLSRVTFTSNMGETYIVRVAGWIWPPPQQGPFVLTVTTTLPMGACCVGTACTPGVGQLECETTMGGTWHEGMDCWPNPCIPIDYYMDTATAEQGGTGWSGGSWLQYPSGWINQWWPNEFDLARQKRVDLKFWVDFAGAPPTVAVNYTVETYVDPDFPPFDDPPIVRVPVDPPVTAPGYYEFTTLIPFCPKWVSVDVMNNGGDFTIEGTIAHVCLTGPTTGACCVGIVCTDNVSAADCATLGGIYKGDGSVCDPVPTACYGDADCTGAVDFGDINYFVAALAGGETGWSSYYQSMNGVPPPCSFWNCDANASGRCLDPQAPEVDFDDINPFVAEIVAGKTCPPP